MRFIPDWLVYTLALLAIVGGVFANTPDEDAPPATPDSVEREGATLPPPSAFDETVLVRVESPKDGIGTAPDVAAAAKWAVLAKRMKNSDAVLDDFFRGLDADAQKAALEAANRFRSG